MEENEDEPEDVRLATPVEDEIKKAEEDEPAKEKPKIAKRKNKDGAKKRKRIEEDEDCCANKKRVKRKQEPKWTNIHIFEKECKPPKPNIIPRHCLSKKEHLDVLATPSSRCPPQCLKKPALRKLVPIPPRIVELARPARQRILKTIEDRGDTIAPELLDNLIKMVEAEVCLTPEQAAQLFHDKRNRSTKKCKKKTGKIKCKSKKDKDKDKRKENGDHPSFDPEAVCCQYLMAEQFVKSILDWKCPIPREEYHDIAEVILRRLSFVLEYIPVDNGDRKSQQMRLLADVVSCWISGVLLEVAKDHEKELREECERRRQEKEEETEEEEEEESEKEESILTRELDEESEEDEGEEEEEKKDKDKIKEQDNKSVQKDEESKDDDKPTKPQEEESSTQTADQPAVVDKDTEIDDKIVDEAATPEGPDEESEKKRKEEEEAEKKRIEEEQEAEQNRKEKEEEAEKKRIEEEQEAEQKRKEEEEAEKKKIEEEEAEQKKKDEEAERKRKEEEAEQTRKEEEAEQTRKEVEAEQTRKEEEEKAEQKRKEEEAEKKKIEEEAEQKRGEEEEAQKKRLEEDELLMRQTEVEKEVGKDTDREKESFTQINKEPDQKPLGTDSAKIKEFSETSPIGAGPPIKVFQSDLPFVTFIKIFNTIYNMIESEQENIGQDPITNRLHRAVYEKFHNAVKLENPTLLTDNAKDVINVISGKIAIWLSKILSESQVLLLDKYPPEVESVEVRDWSKWLNYTTQTAGNWTIWLQTLIKEAQKMQDDKITRGQWQEWTKNLNINASLWRKFHLDTVHKGHHNAMMIKDREVVKTGKKKTHEQEKELNVFDFE